MLNYSRSGVNSGLSSTPSRKSYLVFKHKYIARSGKNNAWFLDHFQVFFLMYLLCGDYTYMVFGWLHTRIHSNRLELVFKSLSRQCWKSSAQWIGTMESTHCMVQWSISAEKVDIERRFENKSFIIINWLVNKHSYSRIICVAASKKNNMLPLCNATSICCFVNAGDV